MANNNNGIPILDIKSINIAIINDTTNAGTHNEGFVFGSGGTTNLINSTATASIVPVVGSTADVTASWSLTLVVPKGFVFRRTTTVVTSTGAVTLAHYSDSMDSDGNTTITFIADAEDTGGPISNGEDVTINWQAYDISTEHSTIFSVRCQSDNSGHSATVKVRFTEGGTLHEFQVFAGDALMGPFSEVEVDSLSNADATAFVYYQEH